MTEPTQEHVYRITEVVRVVDGDTYWLRVDTGFRQTTLVNIRLAGYDCPESTKGSPFERTRAKAAKAFAALFLAQLSDTHRIYVRTEPDPDDFGRWLGHIWDDTGLLGDLLHTAELATVWPTRWWQVYDPKGRAA